MKNPMPGGHSMWIAYVKVGDVKSRNQESEVSRSEGEEGRD